MRTLSNISFWLLLIIVLLIAAMPVVTNSATMREDLFSILMVVTLASSINIIMGYTGYVSFGHIVFFGLGGYFAFYLVQTFGANVFLAALASGGAVVYDRLRSSLITNETFSNFNQFIAGVLLLIIVLFVTAGVIGWLRQRVPALRRYLE